MRVQSNKRCLLAKRLQGDGDAHHARGQEQQRQRDAGCRSPGRRRGLGPVRDVNGATAFAVRPLLVAANGSDQVALALRLVEGRNALAVRAPAEEVAPVAPANPRVRNREGLQRCQTCDKGGDAAIRTEMGRARGSSIRSLKSSKFDQEGTYVASPTDGMMDSQLNSSEETVMAQSALT